MPLHWGLARVNPDERPKKMKPSLVALSTAALLTVYAAGYARTRPAAERFAAADTAQRPGVSGAPNAIHTDAVPPAEKITAAMPSPAGASPRHVSQSSVTAAPPPPVVAPTKIDSTIPTLAVTEPPAVAPAADTTRMPVAGQAVDSAVSAADKPRAQLKDGIYTGWGTSRHGDIEASVEIKSGRIITASITQCLTRYSCSWIAALPGQIVARQRADVDLVSGATQSTNAFYDAIVEALAKAK
jgi:uncharacterized protein with FMN-binding domain